MTSNYERAFVDRPEVFAGWAQLNGAIKERMDPRRYELVTLAAALKLRSTYCSLAHGKALLERFDAPVLEIARDRHGAALSEIDLAVMDLAERIVDDATAIEHGDLQRLRDLGLSDVDIADVAYAASVRCFFSKTLDALGILADASFRELEPDVRDALVVGRPIAPA